jgi:hypothetical protein
LRCQPRVDGPIFEDSKRLLYERHVIRGGIDEEVDVLGRSPAAVGNHRETADENVARAGLIQGAAASGLSRRLMRG